MFDVIVVGGGPAGLSAALVLGRCRRSVLLIDSGRPRNHAARAVHNFLTREGVSPNRLRAIGAHELDNLGIRRVSGLVTSGTCKGGVFDIRLKTGRRFTARKLLLATGVNDRLPDLPGVERFYGTSVHHCPYCDGFEWSGRRLAAYGGGSKGAGLALSLLAWSRDVTVLTGGRSTLRASHRKRLAEQGVKIIAEPIERLAGRHGRLAAIVLKGGNRVPCDAMFFNTGQTQRSSLPHILGCVSKPDGGIRVDRRGRTGVLGLFVAGDALRDIQFAINAAADGATAAVAIHAELQAEAGRTLEDR